MRDRDTHRSLKLLAASLACLAAGREMGVEGRQLQPPHASSVIQFSDFAEARELAQETASPGGLHAAYVVTIPDVRANTRREELYVASTDGRSIRRIETPPQSSPGSIQWMPDGRRFAFLLREGRSSQVYVGDATTGAASAVTRIAGVVDEYTLSPDGTRLALIATGQSGRQIWAVDSMGTSEATPLTGALDEPSWLRWHPDGTRLFYIRTDRRFAPGDSDRPTPPVVRWQNPPRVPRHVWSFDTDTKQERSWTDGADVTVLSFQIAPDGNHLAFQTNVLGRTMVPNDNERATLRLIGLVRPSVRIVVPQYAWVSAASYAFAPDGRILAFAAPDEFAYGRNQKIFTLDLATGRQRKWLDGADFSVRAFSWNETADGVFFTAGVGTEQPFFWLAFSDGAYRRVSTAAGVYHGRYAASAHVFVFAHSTTQQPFELFAATTSTLATRERWVPLSRANVRLAGLPRVETRTMRWKARDGRDIEGLLYEPLGYRRGERYPMIVQVGGGMNAYASGYQSYAPLLASRGYLVFQVNCRGLSLMNYGEAHRSGGFHPNEVYEVGAQDVVSGVEQLVREGVADGDRIGLMGWSAGGGIADWLQVRTHLFKAISSGAGGGDMVAAYGQIDQYRFFYRQNFGGSAFRSWDYYASRSALRAIDRAGTPTLISVGENDTGVVEQCRETYNALVEFGVPAEMMVHVGQPHILQTPQSVLAKMLSEYYWFDQWVRGGPSWLMWRDDFDAITRSPTGYCSLSVRLTRSAI